MVNDAGKTVKLGTIAEQVASSWDKTNEDIEEEVEYEIEEDMELRL